MERVPEPELMDDAAQAQAYAQADCAPAHDAFVVRFKEMFTAWPVRRAVDLGCGSGDVTLRFARAFAACEVTGIDASEAMLACAQTAIVRADLAARVRVHRAYIGADVAPDFSHAFDTVISNSLLHHLADPHALWRAVRKYAQVPAAIWVMDLRRPASPTAAQGLVAHHAANEPALFQRDFYRSLLAAYTVAEVERQLAVTGLAQVLRVAAIGDRHLCVAGVLPPA